MRQERHLSATPWTVARLLALIVLGLTVMSALGHVAVHVLPDFPLRDRFGTAFDVDEEGNVPSLYSTLALVAAAVLLLAIARQERAEGGRFARRWTVMSAIFFYLAADEYLEFHEEIDVRLHLPGITEYSWVFVGMIAVAVFAVAYVPLLRSLTPFIRRMFLLSGATYAMGVIVMELIGGHYVDTWGHGSTAYAVCTGLEELFEMVGIVLFIYTLLTYLTRRGSEVVLGLAVRPEPARTPVSSAAQPPLGSTA
jgi:hypothetical protein